jgi:hypothetical protein
VRPGEHALRCLDIHELTFDEQLEHSTAERLGERGDIMQRQPDERTVGPEPAIGDEQVEVEMPVGQRAVRLD